MPALSSRVPSCVTLPADAHGEEDQALGGKRCPGGAGAPDRVVQHPRAVRAGRSAVSVEP